MNYSELGDNTRSNEGKRKKRDCLVEIILSSNVLLVLSKRSNSSIIERSIFVTNFNYRDLFSFFYSSNELFLPWE